MTHSAPHHFVRTLLATATASDPIAQSLCMASLLHAQEGTPHPPFALSSQVVNRLRALCAAHSDQWTVVELAKEPLEIHNIQEWVDAVASVFDDNPDRFDQVQSQWDELMQSMAVHSEIQHPTASIDQSLSAPLSTATISRELANAARVVNGEAVFDMDHVEGYAKILSRQTLTAFWSLVIGSEQMLTPVLNHLDTPELLPQNFLLKSHECEQIGRMFDVLTNPATAGQHFYRYPQNVDAVLAMQAMDDQLRTHFTALLSQDDFVPLSMRATRLQLSLNVQAQSLSTAIKRLAPQGPLMELRPESLIAIATKFLDNIVDLQSLITYKQSSSLHEQAAHDTNQFVGSDSSGQSSWHTKMHTSIKNNSLDLFKMLIDQEIHDSNEKNEMWNDLAENFLATPIKRSGTLMSELKSKRFSKSQSLLDELRSETFESKKLLNNLKTDYSLNTSMMKKLRENNKKMIESKSTIDPRRPKK